MIEFEKDGNMLRFKKNITLHEFSKALEHYNELVRVFTGKNGTYGEFTDWLLWSGYVEEELKPQVTIRESL